MSKARELADVIGTQDTTENVLQGRKNLIINGDMQVAQRGTSHTGFTNGAEGYTLDRWRWNEGGAPTAVCTITQESDAPDGFAYSWKNSVTTAQPSLASNDYVNLDYWLEAQDLQNLAYGTSNAKKLTLSFWMKASQTGTFAIWFYQPDSGGRTASVNYTVSSAGTWEYKTVTIDGDTSGQIDNDTGQGLGIRFSMAAGSGYTSGTISNGAWSAYNAANTQVGQPNLVASTSDYFQITGVQLEVGSVATPFEHRSYGEELALCQRYYQEFTSSDGSGRHFYVISDQNGAGHSHYLPFMTQMRVAPSAASYVFGTLRIMEANGGYQTTGLTMQGTSVNSPTGFAFYITGINADRRDSICTLYDSSFTFTFDAEL